MTTQTSKEIAAGLAQSRPGSIDIRFAGDDQAVQIHPQIWMSEGASNSYLITTDDGNVLINTGLEMEAPVHQRCFAQVSEAPIRAILLTQGHVDHVGGIDLFKRSHPQAQVYGQRNSAQCQRDDERIQGYRYRRNVRFYPEFLQPVDENTDFESESGLTDRENSPPPTSREPDQLFDQYHQLQVGELQIELISVPGGETTDSTLIWLPQHRVLFSGNTLGPLFPHMPNFYTIRGDRLRFALPYLDAIQSMIDLQPQLLITGHFEPIAGAELLQEEMIRLRDAVRYVHDQTVAGMNAGKDVFTLMKEVSLPASLAVGEDYGTVPWAVRAIYEGYGGWFQFQSTTEIYPVQVREVYGELAQLAGSDRLAERARQLLGAGSELEAIHLAEVALSAEPEHQLAWEVYLQAHEQLLLQSHQRNRWQKYWLQGEIDKARTALGK